MINLVALSYWIFSLGHVPIDCAFGAAMPIAHGDLDGGDKDGHDGVRSAAKSGGYCAAKTTYLNKTLVVRVIH